MGIIQKLDGVASLITDPPLTSFKDLIFFIIKTHDMRHVTYDT